MDLLDLRGVAEFLGYELPKNRKKVDRLVASPDFPVPYEYGSAQSRRWLRRELERWREQRRAA